MTVGASALTVAMANDFYIANYETLYLAAFATLMRLLYLKLGPIIDDFATKGLAVRLPEGSCVLMALYNFFGW